MNTTIIIPTWNGKDILVKSLPIVIKNSACKIIVIDDGSIDETLDFLRKFPNVQVLSNEKNLGFTKSVNKALKHVKTEYVCLLNNDVYPKDNYLIHALKIFKDKYVAAVTFNEQNSSWPKIAWKDGKLNFMQGDKDGNNHNCLWPSGGSSVMRTAVFKELGGFNEAFSPGYFEDIELGFRLWRSGYKVVWSNDAQVVHKHETSFSKLDPSFVSDLKQVNELVFTWLTFDNQPYLFDHILFLFRHSLQHPGYLRIILLALRKYLHCAKSPSKDVLSIDQILMNANSKYE